MKATKNALAASKKEADAAAEEQRKKARLEAELARLLSGQGLSLAAKLRGDLEWLQAIYGPAAWTIAQAIKAEAIKVKARKLEASRRAEEEAAKQAAEAKAAKDAKKASKLAAKKAGAGAALKAAAQKERAMVLEQLCDKEGSNACILACDLVAERLARVSLMGRSESEARKEEERFKAARKAAKQLRRTTSGEQQAAAETLQAFVHARKSNALLRCWHEACAALKAKAKIDAEALAMRLAVAERSAAAAEKAAPKQLKVAIAQLEAQELQCVQLAAMASILLSAAMASDGGVVYAVYRSARMRGGTGNDGFGNGADFENFHFEEYNSQSEVDNSGEGGSADANQAREPSGGGAGTTRRAQWQRL